MKKIKLNTVAARSVAAGCAVGLLMAAQTAVACTVDNWTIDGDVTAGVEAGGPAATVTIPRYSGLCSMRTPVNPGQPEYVQNDSPSGLSRIRARFYVFAANSGDAVVYQGFDAQSNSVFEVTLDASEPEVDFTALGTTVSQPYNPGSWNSIEIDWNAGTGELELIVNGSAAPISPGSSSETVDFVRMGNLTPVAEELYFDAYESRRMTAVGRLCVGDADSNNTRGIGDLEAIFDEFQFDQPAPGNPDADEDGEIGIGDLEAVFQIFQFETAACPE